MPTENFNALDAFRNAKLKHEDILKQFEDDYGFDSGIIDCDTTTYHHIDSLINIQKTTFNAIELSLRKMAEKQLVETSLYQAIDTLSNRKLNNIIKATNDMAYYTLDEYYNPITHLFYKHNDEKEIKVKDKDVICLLLHSCLPLLQSRLNYFVDFNANTLYSNSGFVAEVCDMLTKIALQDELCKILPLKNCYSSRTKI